MDTGLSNQQTPLYYDPEHWHPIRLSAEFPPLHALYQLLYKVQRPIVKFADDTVVVSLINNNELA